MVLHSFLTDAIANRIMTYITSQARIDSVSRKNSRDRFDDGWILCGPPHIRRFFRFQGSDSVSNNNHDCGQVLDEINSMVLKSDAFGRWLKKITGHSLHVKNEIIRHFRSGQDYTVALPCSTQNEGQVCLTLCFVDDFSLDKKRKWSDGDVGGYACYMKPAGEQITTAADVYKSEDDGSVVSIDASFNTLSILAHVDGGCDFVKFISKSAPSDRWDISLNMSRGV